MAKVCSIHKIGLVRGACIECGHDKYLVSGTKLTFTIWRIYKTE